MTAEPESSFELQIDRLTNAGDGVGRTAQGQTVFVPFSAPGDRLRVRVVERRPRFLRAEVEELLEPGPGRTDPRCAEFGRCGGCTWQHLSYPEQVVAKREILGSAIQRIGKLDLPEDTRFIESPDAYAYRARARIRVLDGMPGYRRRASHEFCAAEVCPILIPALQQRWSALRDERPKAEGEWELASDAGEGTRAFPLDRVEAVAMADRLALRVGRDRIEVSPGGFYQSNATLFDALTAAVWDAVGAGDQLLELYAGAGFFTLELARRFGSLHAVEQSPGAVADLRRNLSTAGLDNVRVSEARVEEFLESDPVVNQVDIVLLDPPRTGLGKRGVKALLDQAHPGRLKRIVYLSCDPATLARDLAGLSQGGFRLAALTGIDLFPQTPHVEALAVLER